MNPETDRFYEEDFHRLHYEDHVGAYTGFQHRMLERGLPEVGTGGRVLEVGAGRGEHLAFVRGCRGAYVMLDLRDRSSDIAASPVAQHLSRSFMVGSGEELPLRDDCVDRLIATCLVLHLTHPDRAFQEWRRVCRDGATLSLLLPCDPGMLYRWGRHWVVHRRLARLADLPMAHVKYLWAYEHRNHYLAIVSMLRWHFRADRMTIRRYPVRWGSWNMNVFTIVRITVVKPGPRIGATVTTQPD